MWEPSQKRQKQQTTVNCRGRRLSLPKSLYATLFDGKCADDKKYEWKKYLAELCPLPTLQGRSPHWMPWFPETRDVLGYYLDEPSQLHLRDVYDQLAKEDGGGADDGTSHKELLFKSWGAFPRLILNRASFGVQTAQHQEQQQADDDDDDEDTSPSPLITTSSAPTTGNSQARFIPRAFVAGQSVLLPYIWLHLSDDGSALTVRESTIVASDFRIALASSRNGHTLASIHLPVYRRFPRQLVFPTKPVKQRTVYFDGCDDRPYVLDGGAKALLATMIAKESTLLRKEDDLDPIMSEGGDIRGIKMNFHMDIVVRFDDETGTFDGVTGTHATQKAMYYVLVEHRNRHCLYAFHGDDFRGPDEATGLDLHYPHPLTII